MQCRTCGRESANPEANYCDYCGASFRGEPEVQDSYDFNRKIDNVQVDQRNAYGQYNVQEESERPISFRNWLAVLLLPLLPIVGIFVYLALLFVWAFGRNIAATKKNWARASLVMLIITMIMFGSLLSSNPGLLQGL